ncbi:MAG TPA: sugar transferase, partial [Acidimicrobiia bacterium]|nr:sugar transferase [Acidimicrobiia bacterium]
MVQTRARDDTCEQRAISPDLILARGSRFLRVLLVGLDATAVVVSWIVTTALWPRNDRTPLTSVLLISVLVFVQLGVFNALGLYRARVCSLRAVEYARVARGCLVLALCALAVAAFRRTIVTPGEVARWIAATFLALVLLRSGYRAWLTDCRRAGRYQRPILLVGTGHEAAEMLALLSTHPELGYRAVAAVGDPPEALANGLANLPWSELDNTVAMFGQFQATGALICAGDLPSSRVNRIVRDLLDAGAHVQLTSGLRGVDIGRIRPAPLAHEPLFYVEPVTLASWQLGVKRALDTAIASLMLTLSAPLLALAALAIKVQGGGPVLFRQVRVGRHGTPFTLYKLR